MTPYLTDDEIAFICAPLTQPAAQLRHLRGQGFVVLERPNGRPLISRGNYEQVTSGKAPTQDAANVRPGAQPNRAGLLTLLHGRGVKSPA